MDDTRSRTAPPDSASHTASSRDESRTPGGDFGGSPELMIARAWVRENQLTALFGAFTVGAFLGVMMRR